MRFVHILVEGQTEETFIRAVLNPYMSEKGISFTPILVTTKRIAGKPDYKGGISKYTKIKKDIERLLGDSSVTAVTSMLDYYGIPRDFPGLDTLQGTNCYEKIRKLENNFLKDISSDRFIPYLSLHEFEALLFVSPQSIAAAFSEILHIENKITSVKDSYGSPEEINLGEDTHPSAQLMKLIPYYKKRLHGSIISGKIGITAMRQQCPFFNEWVNKLESL